MMDGWEEIKGLAGTGRAVEVGFNKIIVCHDQRMITRSSADADKPARRTQRSVKLTKHNTIPYVSYSFLLCKLCL